MKDPRIIKWLSVLVVIAGYVGVASSSALAADAQDKLPVESRASLLKKHGVGSHHLVSSKVGKLTKHARDGSCWRRQETWVGRSLAGKDLFKYWQTTRVCRREGKVFEVEVTNKGQQSLVSVWEKGDAATTQTQVAANKESGNGLAEFHFKLKIAGLTLTRSDVCILQKLGVRRGVYKSSNSCNVSG